MFVVFTYKINSALNKVTWEVTTWYTTQSAVVQYLGRLEVVPSIARLSHSQMSNAAVSILELNIIIRDILCLSGTEIF